MLFWRKLLGCAVMAGLLFPSVVASVELREVEFRLVQPPRSRAEWLECSIEIEVRRDEDAASRKHPEFVDDLGVRLAIGVEADRPAGRSFEFYDAEATLVSVSRKGATVRFYLPPELVERDRLRREVHSFLVRLAINGEPFAEVASDSLQRPDIRRSFLARVAVEAPANDGLLRVQPDTPFEGVYPESTPTYRNSGTPQGNTES